MAVIPVLYVIECWDSQRRRYVRCWSGTDRERASIMFHKAYYRPRTRRLIKVTTVVDLQAKGLLP